LIFVVVALDVVFVALEVSDFRGNQLCYSVCIHCYHRHIFDFSRVDAGVNIPGQPMSIN
jgi:hypothetical protein